MLRRVATPPHPTCLRRRSQVDLSPHAGRGDVAARRADDLHCISWTLLPRSSSPRSNKHYAALIPVAEALLRVVVGVALVPHGLRMTFGFFPDTGMPAAQTCGCWRRSSTATAIGRADCGRRSIAVTQLVGGPLFALGLFTRVAAVPIVVFLAMATLRPLAHERLFLEQAGLEYTLLWGVAALYFLVHGGGIYSLDHLLGG